MQAMLLDAWAQRKEQHPPNARVYASWVNVATPAQPTAPYTIVHNHLGMYPRTVITGTFYASSGYDDLAESSAFSTTPLSRNVSTSLTTPLF